MDGLVHGHQLGVQGLLIAHVLDHGQVILFKAQLGDAEIGNGLVQKLIIGMLPIGLDDLEVLQILLSGLNVAAVGEVPAAFGRDDGHALGNVEGSTIIAGITAGQQQAVGLPSKNGAEFFHVVHFEILLSFAKAIQGSSATWRSFSQTVWLWMAFTRMDCTLLELAPSTSV